MATTGPAKRRPGQHVSRCRMLFYSFDPEPEIHPIRPLEAALEAAKKAGTVHQWWCCRTGQSWAFEGMPGPGMRAFVRRFVALLGGPEHAGRHR